MNLTILTNNLVNPKDFVEFWSSFYNYQFERYYTPLIGKKRFSKEDLVKLFEWKNGGKLSQRKKQALDSIIDKLEQINALKSKFSKDTFLEKFGFVKGPIWKLYLLHIIQPEEFPIFDQHVYRAYHFISEKKIVEIPSSPANKQNVYFSKYVPFFNKIWHNGISKKKLDEALWCFGKFLKTPYAKKYR